MAVCPDSHWMPTGKNVVSDCKLIIHGSLTPKSLPLVSLLLQKCYDFFKQIHILFYFIFFLLLYLVFLNSSSHIPQTSLLASGRKPLVLRAGLWTCFILFSLEVHKVGKKVKIENIWFTRQFLVWKEPKKSYNSILYFAD